VQPSAHGRAVLGALAGALIIATSAILVRQSGASAAPASFFRCLFALPVLGALSVRDRRRRPALPARGRWTAWAAGGLLAVDLVLWSRAIGYVGAGLATVLANLQVLLVAGLAWWLLDERPSRSLLAAVPAMVVGVALISGVGSQHTYGANPGLGALFGAVASVAYAAFLLVFRHGMPAPGPGNNAVQPLFHATVGATAGCAVLALATRDFALGPAWPALGWLALLAMSSQVVAWLLITNSLPRLPAALTSAVLLVQPVGAVALGALLFAEHPSPGQLAGVALVLVGVLVATAVEPLLARFHLLSRSRAVGRVG